MATIDRRERILLRLKAILDQAVTDGKLDSAWRNRAGLEGLPGRKGLILDGDEVVRLSTRGHEDQQSGRVPQNLMTVIPEIFLAIETPTQIKEDRGPQYSAMRTQFIPLFMRDKELLTILDVASGGQIEYLGFETDLKNENLMLGQMRLDFGFTYLFDPDEL